MKPNDALNTLGTLIDEKQGRDAIHLAVEPMIAGEGCLFPGCPIGIGPDGMAYSKGPKIIGIVDPFLDKDVEQGQRFWMVVYPRTITSLRHVWTHPDLPNENNHSDESIQKQKSEQWLRNFIARADCPGYETVIAAALNNHGSWSEEYLHFNGLDAHGDIPPEFWDHVEIVTGQKIAAGNRAKYFSCSC